MKIAVIGTSWITDKFLSAALKTNKYSLEAVFSRSEEKGIQFGEKYGTHKVYTSLEALGADTDIKSVYIASPNSLHFEQSRFLLKCGKNIICEKPAATTYNEEKELTELAERCGRIRTEAIMSMYVPAFEKLKEAIRNIGRIRTANIVYCQLSSKYPAYIRGENPNIFNPAFHTGCLADIGVYNVFLATGLFGSPNAIMSHSTFLESGADAEGTAILNYGDMTVNLVYSKVGQSYSPSEIIGDEGTVSINSVSQLTGIDIIKDGIRTNIVPYGLTRDEVMGAEASVFADAVSGDKKAIEKVRSVNEISLKVRRICDEIRKQNDFPF